MLIKKVFKVVDFLGEINSTSGHDNYKDKALPQNEKKTRQINLKKDIF